MSATAARTTGTIPACPLPWSFRNCWITSDAALLRKGPTDAALDIVTRHRLQSFSEEYFTDDTDSRLFSYSTENRAALESRRISGLSRRAFIDAPLAADPQLWQELDLQQLIRFLHNPARQFLAQRMNLRPYDPAEELEEQEPFAIDSLGGYSLKQELTARLLNDESCDGLYAAARARGLLPPLHAGTLAFEAARAETQCLCPAGGRPSVGTPGSRSRSACRSRGRPWAES